MKILHIVECFGGGVYDFIKNLTYDMNEYEITILYGDRGELKTNFKSDFNKNIKFIKWENAQREISFFKDIKALKEVIKILKREKYDVIHLHSSKAGFLGRIGAKLLGQSRKIVYTTHGISFLRQDVSNIKLKLFILLEKIGEFCGGQTIACSKSEAEFIRSKGINCKYINNGIKIDENFIKQSKKDDITRIINVGRIAEQKNPRLFNEIAQKYTENPKVKFIWVGDGEDKKLLSSKNIEITGWLSQELVKEKLKSADIYLSTSKWEGLSLAILQAMNYELPLVLSNCVGNIDLVEEGINGNTYTEIDEGIEKINKIKLDQGKKSLILLKEKFNIKNMIENYKEYYGRKIWKRF